MQIIKLVQMITRNDLVALKLSTIFIFVHKLKTE